MSLEWSPGVIPIAAVSEKCKTWRLRNRLDGSYYKDGRMWSSLTPLRGLLTYLSQFYTAQNGTVQGVLASDYDARIAVIERRFGNYVIEETDWSSFGVRHVSVVDFYRDYLLNKGSRSGAEKKPTAFYRLYIPGQGQYVGTNGYLSSRTGRVFLSEYSLKLYLSQQWQRSKLVNSGAIVQKQEWNGAYSEIPITVLIQQLGYSIGESLAGVGR